MKNICVITGASSGIGKEFFISLVNDKDFSFDEFWVIARSEDRLKELEKLCSIPVRAIPLDLSDENSYDSYKKLLEEEEPRISLLVNCSGYGKFESVENVGYEANLNMIDLNVKGTVAMDYLSLAYMDKGCGIINIASVAAYQPIPYINTYGDMINTYADETAWTTKSLMNIAGSGFFAADRSIEEYAEKFWNLKKITGNK